MTDDARHLIEANDARLRRAVAEVIKTGCLKRPLGNTLEAIVEVILEDLLYEDEDHNWQLDLPDWYNQELFAAQREFDAQQASLRREQIMKRFTPEERKLLP